MKNYIANGKFCFRAITPFFKPLQRPETGTLVKPLLGARSKNAFSTVDNSVKMARKSIYTSLTGYSDKRHVISIISKAPSLKPILQLHTLEDFAAHSNFCELSLYSMGFTQVFLHVGDNARIQAPGGKWVAPLVTGSSFVLQLNFD